VASAVSAPVDCEPLAALAPDQAPDALQLVASVDVQPIDATFPLVIELGGGLKVIVGAGAAAEIMADCEELPPAPVHVKV
jgi:hypothetical protein